MIITSEIKELAAKVSFAPLVTVSNDGEPHLIVAGKVAGFREDGIIVFTAHKMKVTQENIKANGKMQVVLANRGDKTQGIRLSGKATIVGKDILLKTETVHSLL